jgi:hypothetical protein
MNAFNLVCGTLLVGLGGWTVLRAPRVAAAAPGGIAVTDAKTQRYSGASLAFFGACVLVDAFRPEGPTFAALGLAVIFGASVWENRLAARKLRAAGVPADDARLRAKRFFVVLANVAAALWLIYFAGQFFSPFKS